LHSAFQLQTQEIDSSYKKLVALFMTKR